MPSYCVHMLFTTKYMCLCYQTQKILTNPYHFLPCPEIGHDPKMTKIGYLGIGFHSINNSYPPIGECLRPKKKKKIHSPNHLMLHTNISSRPKNDQKSGSLSMITSHTVEKSMERWFQKVKKYWLAHVTSCFARNLVPGPKLIKMGVE